VSRRIVHAPAKINLGLEILGKRKDGYHEVCTILSTISLHDTLVFEKIMGTSDVVETQPEGATIPDSDNLVVRALTAMRAAGADIPAQHITLHKRIPAAAGLGGASSDAAATVMAFSAELEAVHANSKDIAGSLGSDVPFFLDGPVALAAGRGERLTRLPAPSGIHWAVLATPTVRIANKTPTMYRAVEPSTWSSGDLVREIAAGLPNLPDRAPYNVFERALVELHPELDAVRDMLRKAGFPFVALSGAGPTFYTLVTPEEEARSIVRRLAGAGLDVNVATLGWIPPAMRGGAPVDGDHG
jgi:4-diphosphocytidyl-2-C-methyl-D-erythritol kinase